MNSFLRSKPLVSLATLERARKLGTLNRVDRTPQYEGPEFAKPEKLQEAVNVQGTTSGDCRRIPGTFSSRSSI